MLKGALLTSLQDGWRGPTILQYGGDVPGALLILYKVELRV